MSTCNSESAAFPFSALLSELWRTREFEQFLFAHIFIICSTAIWLTVDGNQSRQLMRSAGMTSLSLELLTISLLQKIFMTRFLVCFNDIRLRLREWCVQLHLLSFVHPSTDHSSEYSTDR